MDQDAAGSILKLLGGASIEGPAGPVTGPAAQRQRLAILALLALAPTGRLSRDKLLAYLWPDSDDERSRHALSNALYTIKRALGEEAVVASGEDLQLNRDVVRVDAIEFGDAIAAGELEQAAALYAGPFLDGLYIKDAPEFEKWLDAERSRLERAYGDLLERLATQESEQGRPTDAVEWWRRRAALDYYDARVAVALMNALEAAGNRAEAIKHAAMHANLLREDLGAEPDPAVAELAETLRRAGGGPARSPERQPPAEKGAPREPSAAPTPSGALPPDRAGRTLPRWAPAAIVLGGLALVVLWFTVLRQPTPVSPAAALGAADGTPSIAVLPFDNMSPDPEDAYFSDGMHDEIITQLSKISGLAVISRTSVLRYRDTDRPIPEIARELGVSAVLEGATMKAGDQVRITTQLIDGRTDRHLWAESYERGLSPANVLAIQSEIARQVTDALEAVLTPEESVHIAAVPTERLEAYQLYLRGRQHYYEYRPDDNEEAIRLFKLAVEDDPEYALAWAGLGDAYAQSAYVFGRPAEWLDSAEVASRRAIRLAPEVAEGWKALGLVFTVRGWVQQSIEAYERALEFNPNHSGAINNLAMAHLYQGRVDEALLLLKRAARVAPTRAVLLGNVASRYIELGELGKAEPWVTAALGLPTEQSEVTGVPEVRYNLYWAGGQVERALREAEADAARSPSDPAVLMRAARAAAYARRYHRARMHIEAARRIAGDDLPNLELVGFVYMSTGDQETAEEFLRRALERARYALDQGSERPEVPLTIAEVHAVRGDVPAALSWLHAAYEAGYRAHVWLELYPMFDSVREEPEYRALISRMESDMAAMRLRVAREDAAAQ